MAPVVAMTTIGTHIAMLCVRVYRTPVLATPFIATLLNTVLTSHNNATIYTSKYSVCGPLHCEVRQALHH